MYDDLLRLARARMMRFGSCESLSPPELVHEAYLRVVRGEPADFKGRRHFFFVVSRAMHDLMVENIRRQDTFKRGRGCLKVELEKAEIAIELPGEDHLDLHRALRKLAQESRDCAQVVVLSYFVGLTHPEIAEFTGVSRATIERRWSDARAWLRQELGER